MNNCYMLSNSLHDVGDLKGFFLLLLRGKDTDSGLRMKAQLSFPLGRVSRSWNKGIFSVHQTAKAYLRVAEKWRLYYLPNGCHETNLKEI